MSTSNFVEYDPIAAAKGFTELPPEPSKGKSDIDWRLLNSIFSCQEKCKKESRKSQKKCRSEKSREWSCWRYRRLVVFFEIVVFYDILVAVVAGLDKAKIEDKKPEEKVDLSSLSAEEKTKQVKKRNKLLRQIEELEAKKESGEELTPDQKIKIDRKQIVLDELKQLQN